MAAAPPERVAAAPRRARGTRMIGRMTRRALLPILLAAGACAVAPSVAGAAAGSHSAAASWSKDATAICKRYGKQIDALPEPKTLDEAAASTLKILDLATRQTNEIAKLSKPAKDAKTIDELLGYWRQQLGVVKDMAAAMKKADQAAVSSLMAKGDGIDKKVTALGKKLGVNDCVN